MEDKAGSCSVYGAARLANDPDVRGLRLAKR